MVVVSAYMGGTRGSGDVLEMSMVRSVGEVCDMCMCLARDGEVLGARGLCLGFTNLGGTGGVSGRLGPGSGRMGWC